MLLENKYIIINQLKIDLTFENNVQKSVIVKTNDIVETEFKSDNKKDYIKGRVDHIKYSINNSLGRTKSSIYIKIDGSDEYYGKTVYINPEDILDLTVLETTDTIINPICSINNDDQRIILLRENEVGNFQYSKDGSIWYDTGKGPHGLSAYEVAIELGFVGTEEEWLASLKGRDGIDGKSAYQVAVENGFVGTEEKWLESLKGKDGTNGINGVDGKSAYQVAVDKGFSGTEEEWLVSLKGSNGADGKSAYQIAVRKGFTGTEEEWLESLKGEKGKDGIDGDNGDSAYQTALDSGFIGTEEAWLESLKGRDGKSAYQVAVDKGFSGTEEDWLASLKGADGIVGADGKSAYQTAIDNGYIGTEEEWLASLKGKDGETGQNGPDGPDGKSAYQVAVENGYVGTEETWLESLKGEKGPSGGDPGKSAYQIAVDNGFQGTEQEWLIFIKGDQGDRGIKGEQGQKGDTPYIDDETGRWFIAGKDTGKVAVPNITEFPEVPTALSQLDNDEHFIKNSANDLLNYYLKNDIYTKQEINRLIGDSTTMKYKVVEQLPVTDIALNTMYLIAMGNNIYSQHMYIDNEWANFGDTTINISNFVTKEALEEALNQKAEKNHTHAELHTHVNKAVLDTITAESVTKWNNGFSGKYNDLTGAPDIPIVTNDLTNELKSSYDQAVEKSHTHINKVVLDKFTESPLGNVLYDGKEISTGGGTGGANIDDSTTSLEKTWSSKKISNEITSVGNIVNNISVAQKTVNTRGTDELLETKKLFNINTASTAGAAVITTLGVEIPLTNDISKYDYISFKSGFDGEITIKSENRVPTKNIVYNNSNTINETNGSVFVLLTSLATSTNGAFGAYHLIARGWFKTPKIFFLHSVGNPLPSTNNWYKVFSIDLITGINIENVTIDPVEYVNTTQGIEDIPVGNIITAVGTGAIPPKHYILYDNKELSITQYPYLAQFIKDQFGYYNYFGGDGINTFCVTDTSANENVLVDVTPIMTSATAPSPYVVTASSYLNSTLQPFKAFDNDNNKVTSGHTWITADNVKTGWIILDFNKKTAISHFSLQCHTSIDSSTTAHMIKDFVLYGSNDNNVYTKIKECYGETNWAFNELRLFDLKGVFKYRYYKVEILDNNGFRYSTIPELRFLLINTESKYIKYEPTYFMNIDGLVETVTLWEGLIGTDKSTEVTNTINLSDSVMNYDKIGVYYQYRSAADSSIRSLYREIPSDEIKRCITSGNTNYKISFVWGYANANDVSDIQPTSTEQTLVLKQILSYFTKVVGIRYKSTQGSGGNGNCECITYTDSEIKEYVEGILYGNQ